MSLRGSSPRPSAWDKCAGVAQIWQTRQAQNLEGAGSNPAAGIESFRIGSSAEPQSAGLRSLRSRVRISPDALCGRGAIGRRAVLRRLLLEVQVLSSAFDNLQVWRNRQTRQSQTLHPEGSNPSTCISVGVAQSDKSASPPR